MNKLIQNLFTLIFPFYPIWAWLSSTFIKKPIDFVLGIILLPIALYSVLYTRRLPKYLLFLILFTIYHLSLVVIKNTFPDNTSKLYYFLVDPNILACLYFIVIENTVFNNRFINKLNKRILIIVIVSLIVSLIQVKNIGFFINANNDEEFGYVKENRIFSIYSWSNLMSIGITFPILISILISIANKKKNTLPIVIFCGVVVSFLTRARYVMISAMIVFSQIIFNNNRSIIKRASYVVFFLTGILFIGLLAQNLGFNIKDVINNRILEKDTEMSSAKARITSYEVFLSVFPENPVFGVGPRTSEKVVDMLNGEAPIIHVGYLCYLYFYGIVGCFFLFLALFYLLKDSWKVGKRNGFWGIFYGLLGFCFANFTTVYFNFSEMGIVISIIYLRYFNYQSNFPFNQFRLTANEPDVITDRPFVYKKI